MVATGSQGDVNTGITGSDKTLPVSSSFENRIDNNPEGQGIVNDPRDDLNQSSVKGERWYPSCKHRPPDRYKDFVKVLRV